MAAPATAAPRTAAAFTDLVRKSGIHPADDLDRRLTGFALPDDAVGAAAALVRGDLLTAFQAKLLLAGRYRGFRVGSYVIRDQLGKGGMGTVYLADHPQLRRKVAVKVLTAAGRAGPGGAGRFLREARAAAALDHPNIVRVFDVIRQGDLQFLVMEHVPGKTLDCLVREAGAVSPARAVGYISQAAAGLQHAYERGFIHRDVKPANLMLAPDGTVKLLDMGLARSLADGADRLTELHDAGAVVGTAEFISPEQAVNAPGIDTRADIYSLGCTLFALIAGQPPFVGSASQVLLQHQMKPPPPLDEFDRTLDPGLAAVVARMLAKSPADRYRTPADVVAALAPWLPNRDGAQKVVAGLSASRAGQSSAKLRSTLDQVLSGGTGRLPARRPARPGRRAWVAGGLAAAAVVAAAAAVLTSGRPAAVAAAPVGPAVTGGPVPDRTPARPAAEHATDFAGLPAARQEAGGTLLYSPRVGTTDLPAGWVATHYLLRSTAEFRVADVAGARAVGVRLTRGASGAQLKALQPALGPAVEVGETLVIRLTYRCDGPGDGEAAVQADGTAPYTRFVRLPLPPTGGEWREVELTYRREAAGPIALIVEPPPAAGDADATLWLKAVRVSRAGGD